MSTTVVEPKQTPTPRVITTERRLTDKIFRGVVTGGGLISLTLLGLIGFFLVYNGFEAMRNAGLAFLTGFDWVDAVPENGQAASYGIGAMLYGTIVTGILAMVMGVPVAVGTALFLSYYAPEWLKKPMVVVVDVMAAIPSIVYGLWGFFVLMPHAEYWAKLIHKYFGFIPFFDMPAPVFTRSPFIAGLVLAIMITPIVTAIAREVFAQTPLERIQAAYALGATKWSMIKAVVFPYGRGGVVGGAMLGLGRAMGETVAVYTVLNIVFQINWHVLLGAGGNIASLIILKFGEANLYEIKGLMAAGLVLFLLTLAVNFLADFIVKRTGKSGR